jgi:hypothetical protein
VYVPGERVKVRMPCEFVTPCIPLITAVTPEIGLPWLLVTLIETVTLVLVTVLYIVEITVDAPPEIVTVLVTTETRGVTPNDENRNIVESGVL